MRASSTSTTPTSPGRFSSQWRAKRTRALSGTARRGTGRLLATETDIGPRTLLRLFGVGNPDVEGGGQDRDERLADARQLLEREPAFVELPLLDPLVDDARHEAADAA